MSRGADRRSERKEKQLEDRGGVKVMSFVKDGEKDSVARKYEVWGLLGWYHHKYVMPNMGLRGFFRRMLTRIFGRRIKLPSGKVNIDYVARISPWAEIDFKNEYTMLMAENEPAPEEEAPE